MKSKSSDSHFVKSRRAMIRGKEDRREYRQEVEEVLNGEADTGECAGFLGCCNTRGCAEGDRAEVREFGARGLRQVHQGMHKGSAAR